MFDREFVLARIEMSPEHPGCWLWTQALQAASRRGPGGYGVVAQGKRTLLAHRISYEAFRGPIPPGLVIDHLCRVHRCVNPDHLEPVSERTNILRGVGASARNAKRTHCPKGHPLDGVTRRHTGRQKLQRYCKTCNSANASAWGRRKRALRAEGGV